MIRRRFSRDLKEVRVPVMSLLGEMKATWRKKTKGIQDRRVTGCMRKSKDSEDRARGKVAGVRTGGIQKPDPGSCRTL